MFTRRWRLAVGLGVVFAGIGAVIAIGAEDGSGHPGGIEFIGALLWRGIVYGAADGLLLSAFPILLVFAALNNSRLRQRVGGVLAVGAIAMVASLAMTAVYHVGYSDFRGSKLRKPVTGDLVWSAPTLATLNPAGAPIAHVGVHIAAVVHSYDTDLFLPPHAALAGPAAAAPVVPTLPVPEGHYAVGRTTLHLVDVKRRDPFKPVRPRELMATVTYPARHAERYPRGAWFGRAVAQDLEARLSAPPTSPAPGAVDLVGAVAHARVHAPIAQPPGWRARGWPVVLFSPGFGASRELNTAQIEDLASRGYVVVSIDHTYEAPVVEFPGGRVARQVPGIASEDPKVLRVVYKRAIDARVADTRFVLDRLAALERGRRPDGSQRRSPAGLRGALDLSRVGMFGYSYGGYTAGEAMLYDRRIDAGINLDGTMAHGFDVSKQWPYAPGEAVKRGLDRAFLLFGHTGNNHLGPTGDPSWQQFWANQRGWKLDLTLRGSAHGSFADLQVAAPQITRGLGLRRPPSSPSSGRSTRTARSARSAPTSRRSSTST